MRSTLLTLFVLFSGGAAGGAEINGPVVATVGQNRNDPARFADGQLAANTRVALLNAVAVAPNGLILLGGDKSVREIAADGLVHTVVTDPLKSPGDRLGADRLGNVYYENFGYIQKVSTAGVSQRIAGFGTMAAQEGMAAADSIIQVAGLAVDPQGNVYFSDSQTLRVWRIDTAGVLRLVVGTGVKGVAGEGGPATSAQLEGPGALALDASGALYIADANRILKVRADGTLLRIGPAATAIQASALAVDATGDVFYAESGKYKIRRIGADGAVTDYAGTGEPGFSNGCGNPQQPALGGDARTAQFLVISSLAVDAAGNLLVVDSGARDALRQISPAGQIRTLLGEPPSFSGDGGPAALATLSSPHGLTFDQAGNLYIADTGNNRIRKVTADGIIHTIVSQGAPTGDMPYSCGGTHDDYLNAPEAVAVDDSGNLYIADTGKHRVMKLTPDGALTRFAGTGQAGTGAAALGAKADAIALDTPRAVGVDRNGNVYIGDRSSRTLKVAPSGAIANVLPRVRTRSFNSDRQGNFYLSASLVSYLVNPDDTLLPLAGLGPGPLINIDPVAPVEEIDVQDPGLASDLTRDPAGTYYQVSPSGVWLISSACNVNPLIASNGFAPGIGTQNLAVSPQGDVYLTDQFANVVWKLPHLTPKPGDLPSPQLAMGAAVRNAASDLISTVDLIQPTGGMSSATFRYLISDDIAPGELVRIKGQCLGPFDTLEAKYDSNGMLPTTLGGVRVLFGGAPAPLISVQSGNIVAVTPSSLVPNQQVDLTVDVSGVQATQTLHVSAERPGLFRYLELDGTATVAAANADGTLNSQAHPALRGSVIALYATGLGKTDPPAIDAQRETVGSHFYTGTLWVTINGFAADLLYAGLAPGFVGLSQLNVRVPDAASSGPVQLLINSAPFKQKVQIWVR